MFVRPAVADGVAYFGSCAGVYYAVDIASGAERWRHDFNRDLGQILFHGDAVIADELLITPGEPLHTHAFDRHTGRTVWQQSGEWALTFTDVVRSGRLVVGRNEDSELIALTADSGTPVWRAPHQARRFRQDVAEAPAVVGTDVIYSATDGAVYRVAGTTGQPRWRTEIGCDVTTSAAVEGDDLYVGCSDGTLLRLRAGDGVELDRMRLGQQLGGRLLVLADRVVVPSGDRWIGAVTRNLDRLIWERRDLPALSVVQPTQWGKYVLTGARDQLIALRSSDGQTAWIASLEGSVRGLGVASDVLLVGTVEGAVYALRGLPDSPH